MTLKVQFQVGKRKNDTQDADHDGWSNAPESAAGKNPLDAAPFPHTSIIADPTGDVLVSWPSEAGKNYIKAILMDPEARDPAMMEVPTFGKLREPFLRVVNMARAFNAASTSGYYPLDQFNLDHLQDPQNSPSVFNFFLPGHSPPGPVTQMGLVAPEFQILNASSAITGANYFYNAIGGNNLHRWGSGTAAYAVRLNLDPELSRSIPAANINEDVPSVTNLMDLDPLIRRFDLMLMGGTMTPRMFQSIRESVDRIKPPDTSWQWHRERLRQLITAIVTSAEFNVMR